MQGLNIERAPSANVVIPHYAFAALSFLTLSILLFFSLDAFSGHYFHPKLLAITHIAALGWASMIIFGALYQLIPVLLETALFSELLAKITFAFFATGIIILTISFWNFRTGLPLQVAASLLFIAITLFTLNIIVTAKKALKWSSEADFIVTSSIWLLITGIIGILMSFNFQYMILPKSHLLFLKIHAHTGIIGWILLLIMGVGSKLIPMFLLSQNINRKRLSYAYYFTNIGLIALSMDLFFLQGSIFLPFSALLIISGILFFISFLYTAYKNRARKQLDMGLKHSFLAFIFILLPMLIAFVISFQWENGNQFLFKIHLVYGLSIFIGFISALILGQTFKTLPFIVWLHKYKKLVGKQKTPLPKDLYSEQLAQWQFWTYLPGVIILLCGVLSEVNLLLYTGSLLLLITAVLYNINVFKLLFHSAKYLKP